MTTLMVRPKGASQDQTVLPLADCVFSPVAGVPILSPLRYPGAKRRLGKYVAEMLRVNSLRPKLFVEPFAGGASVSLQLLKHNLVDRIALGEKDELVSSFWKAVFFDTSWLVEKIRSVPVTLEQWDYFRKTEPTSDRDRALACLFLNRTSFSGIIAPRAGPIGGRAQSSQYTLACRFPVETIVRRIQQASALRDRVLFVKHADWKDTLEAAEILGHAPEDVMYYLDPPFYRKAERLYRYYFSRDDHRALHDRVVSLKERWVVSYDPAPEIIELYSGLDGGAQRVELLYSASSAARRLPSEELIITNLHELPRQTKMWQTSEERKASAGETAVQRALLRAAEPEDSG